MKLHAALLVFCAFLSVTASGDGNSTEVLNLILTKFDAISNKLQHMELKMQELEDQLQKTESMQLLLQSIDQKIQKIENEIHEQRSSQNETLTALHKLEDHVALNFSDLQNQNQEKLHTALHKLDRDVGQVLQIQNNIVPSSCRDILSVSKASGSYMIRVKTDSEPFKVYCEQQKFDGGWIVMQHRYNGSVDFYRGWNEYRDGFGDLNKEFWLGLEKVHQLTKARKHELIVELKDFSEKYRYTRYDAFEIGSKSEGYVLKDLGSHDGTAGHGMWSNKGMKFSSKDRDNDINSNAQCAHIHEGAWWYRDCTEANLNGRYLNENDGKSMFWYDFNDNIEGLSFSRMMIREID